MTSIPYTSFQSAITCVEASVDFSFRTVFRDLSAISAQAGSPGLANLLQIAGRVSRSGEFDGAEVWGFRDDADNGFSLHRL